MKKIILLFILIATLIGNCTVAQVAVSNDGSIADGSAMLDVKSANKGMLIPRMTEAQIGAIISPVDGLMVMNTTDNKMYIYYSVDHVWKALNYGTATIDVFNCGSNLIDIRDGQSYSTVQIGTQCWMAENLNIGIMINGSNGQNNNGTIEKYCYYYNTSNCDTYGGLYQWDEMMQYVTTEGTQGICPADWHIPSDDEWKTLEMYLGMSASDANNTGYRGTDEGEKMKYTSGWDNNGNGTNSSGFKALPGGFCVTRRFIFLGGYGDWWSSSEQSGSDGWYRRLSYNSDQVRRYDDSKGDGFSVRCLKD
jgi:uncharacterized protein (TIGR02145 family)